MLSCDETRSLLEDYLDRVLGEEAQGGVEEHLTCCPRCQRCLEEARFARLVLRNATTIAPPADLAAQIKSAATLHLNHPRRPLKCALGSPAFLATCASLACGALMCLVAILHLSAVQPEASVATPALVAVGGGAAPARMVLVQPTAPEPTLRASRRETVAVRARPSGARPARLAKSPAPVVTAPASRRPAGSVLEVSPSQALPLPVMLRAPATPEMVLTMGRQRISLPGPTPAPSLVVPLGTATAPEGRRTGTEDPAETTALGLRDLVTE
jgi:hypothetical protein